MAVSACALCEAWEAAYGDTAGFMLAVSGRGEGLVRESGGEAAARRSGNEEEDARLFPAERPCFAPSGPVARRGGDSGLFPPGCHGPLVAGMWALAWWRRGGEATRA